MRRLYPTAGRAHLVGITGPPGAGKSTLVAALIGEVRTAGRSVAVVAVDPSSPITGGALLGDRVRMQSYADDDGVFIRSMASRGHAGGLASTSAAAASLLDAAGFDLVLIETVGTGPERGRGRGRRRHDRGPRGARDGRRGPGDQGRPARGRGPGRREQGRQARRPADGGPAPGDARRHRRRRTARGDGPARGPSARRSSSRPPRPARGSRSCSSRSIGIGRPVAATVPGRPLAWPVPRPWSGRSSRTGSSRRSATRTVGRPRRRSSAMSPTTTWTRMLPRTGCRSC